MDWTRRCPQRRSGATSRTKVVGCVERTADSERHADGALVYRFEITLYRSSLAGVRVWTVVCGPCFLTHMYRAATFALTPDHF